MIAAPDPYETRFDPGELHAKDAVWREVVRYLHRHVEPDKPLIDVAWRPNSRVSRRSGW